MWCIWGESGAFRSLTSPNSVEKGPTIPMTRRVRLAQRRDAAGFSQQSLADFLGVDRSTARRWESGESTPRGVTRPKLARALGLTLIELDQLLDVGPELEAGNAIVDGEQTTSLVAVDVEREAGGDVQRRDFLQGLAATGLGVASNFVPLPPTDPMLELRFAVDRAVRFEQRSQYAALRATLPSLIARAEQTSSEQIDGEGRREADRLLGATLLVEAFVLIKHDRPTEARSTATAALNIAEASGDPVLVGAAFRCLSETHLRGSDYELAADLGIEGASYIERSGVFGSEATAVRGACLLSAATARARAGDRRAAYELLAAASTQADRLGEDVISTVVFGPTNVAIHHVAFEVELGDPIQALKFADQMRVEDGRGLEERRSRYLIDVARAEAARRQDTEAIQTLMHAESISPEETRTHRLTKATLVDLLERKPARMATGLVPLAERCGIIEAA